MKLSYRWICLGSGVYASSEGVRFHMQGTIRDTDNNVYHIETHDQYKNLSKCVKIMGDDRRRGLMLYAETYHHIPI